MPPRSEARELEHPVLFEGIPELLKDISDEGGRHFLVSHRNDQVLEEEGVLLDIFTPIREDFFKKNN